jgi:hypothetical protein
MSNKVRLISLAHARSGDKGNNTNIGVIAKKAADYPLLKQKLTADVVKSFLSEFCEGSVERYELDNLYALNFVLQGSLRGGGTLNLRLDSQGKTLGMALLRMELEI